MYSDYLITRLVLPSFFTVDEGMESKPIKCNLMMQAGNNVDIYLDYKKSENGFLYVCKHSDAHYEKAEASAADDGMYKEDKVNVTVEKMLDNANKKVSTKKNKRSQLPASGKENLKKTSKNNKIVQPKATRRSNRVSAANLNKLYKQTDEVKNYTKLELYKVDAGKYLKKAILSPFSHTRVNNTNNIFETNIPRYGVAKQQGLNQLGFDNIRSTLQYSDYSNLRCPTNQQVVATNSNPWLMASKSDQNFALNNIANTQHEMKQSDFIDDKYPAYVAAATDKYPAHVAAAIDKYPVYVAAATDYNRKQNENSYSNFHTQMSSIDPYKLFSSGNDLCNHLHYNIPGTNCTWNNVYTGVNGLPAMDATFQQATNNITSNYMTSAVPNNLLNVMAEPFNNPIHYYQPLQADRNLKKFYYSRLDTLNYANSSGCEVIVKENVTSPFNNWQYTSSLTTPSNNNLNIQDNVTVTSLSDTSPSYPLYTDSTDEHFNNYYNKDAIKSMNDTSKNQYGERDNLNPYMTSAVENILPIIGMHGSDSYKNDLMVTPNYQNSTAIKNNIMSDITDINVSSETSSVDTKEKHSEEFISYIHDKITNISD